MSKIKGMDVKRELTDKRPGDRRGMVAILSGFARNCLTLERIGGKFMLCLDCQSELVRDYVAELMELAFDVQATLGERNSLIYTDYEKLLKGLSITTDGGEYIEGIPQEFSRSSHYVRGVFLACGSMSAPIPDVDDIKNNKSGGYHLEFSFSSEIFANEFVEALAFYQITAHTIMRSERTVVYVKNSQSVSDCLALIGADKTVLRLNEAVAMLAVKRNVARRMSFELANADRTENAAENILNAIKLIDERRGLKTLDKKLYDAAMARLDDPIAPLSEIAEKLNISKSGLKHRYNKIEEIARQISDGKE